MFILEALSHILYRPVIVICGHSSFKPITEFNPAKTKPALYFFMYGGGPDFIVKAAVADKVSSYRLANLCGYLEIG